MSGKSDLTDTPKQTEPKLEKNCRETEYITKCDWANQRELTLAAILLGAGVAIFEVLANIQNPLLLIMLYGGLTIFIVYGIHLGFKFELQVLCNQVALETECGWEEFTFGRVIGWFFTKQPEEAQKARIRLIPVVIVKIVVIIIFAVIFYTENRI